MRSSHVHLATVEIKRRKVRYALLTGAVTLLVFLLLFLVSLSGALVGAITGALESQDTDVLVYSDTSRNNVEASNLPVGSEESVADIEGVESAAPWVEGAFTIVGGTGRDTTRTTVTAVGFVPGEAGAPTRTDATPGPGETLVDAGNSSTYPVGSRVTFDPSGVELEIVGTAENAGFLAQPTFLMDFEQYRDLQAATFPDAPPDLPVNVVAVRLDPGTSASTVISAIERALPGTVALTRSDAVAAIPGVDEISMSFLLVISATGIIVVVVTGFFFVIFTVQKRPAFGTLRAVGAGVWRLGRATLLQIAAVVVVASAIATALLTAALAGFAGGLPATVDPVRVVTVVGTVLAGGLCGGLVSIRRIAAIDPAEAALGRMR
ncbi:MAG: hypothetical protein IT198_13405 [Acidimicrobiia bacterium]|nr:hypothetical protein [Acidimicrobiia bacterium]